MLHLHSFFDLLDISLPSPSEFIYHMLGILALWRAVTVIKMHIQRPTRIRIEYRSFALGRCFFNFDFILDGASLIFKAYQELGKVSFAIPALAEYQVLACSDLDAKAVCDSSEEKLSFHAAMVDRLKHKYTMFGFEHNEVDPHNTVPARTLKVLLRLHLPTLKPLIEARIKEGFQSELSKGTQTCHGWTNISAFELSKGVTERVNSEIFLGPKLANDPNFMRYATQYSHEAIITAEFCRQLPSIFTPVLASVMMGWSGAMRNVGTCIKRVVIERMLELAPENGSYPRHLDCIQWIIQSSQTKAQSNVERLTQQVVAMFFASSHQMPMALVYVIYSLCDNPEYIEYIRSEVRDVNSQYKGASLKSMHLLDAILRESGRLNPIDALSVQRKVLLPFSLPSGAHIPAGNLIAVPQHAMLRNDEIYPNASHFNPYRFFPSPETSRRTRYTDVDVVYPYWGSPKKPCPGRWFVSETLKLTLIHLVMHYDFKLVDEEAPRSFFWTTSIVPRSSTRILLRKRNQQPEL